VDAITQKPSPSAYLLAWGLGMGNKYFDVERDSQFPFFCEACLTGKKKTQMSKRDIRYCVECQPIVEGGYISLGQHRRYLQSLHNQKIEALNSEDNQTYPQKEKEVLLPTKNATSQIDQNPTENRPIPNVGGRPRKDIPAKLIRELSAKGMGIKRIVRELKGQGVFLSSMSIQRVLSGERR